MNTTLTSKGQLKLPKAARDALVLAAGTRFAVKIVDGKLLLTEALWTLRAVYKQPKPALIAAIEGLLGQLAFTFEDRAALAQALANFGGSGAGFSDCLIAARQQALGCEFSATFDRKMRALPGAKLL